MKIFNIFRKSSAVGGRNASKDDNSNKVHEKESTIDMAGGGIVNPGFGVRHLQCFLIFCALSVAYALRVNLSVAIVAMTDSAATNPNFDEFNWTESVKSILLSSFFWGYICTQIPGGALARKFGGKILLFSGVFICSTLAIVTPLCARVGDWKLVCALRVIQGLSQGVLFPSTHTILSKWAPVEERGTLGTYSYSGSQFGTVIMLAISGVMASSSLGWPSIFYVPGIVGILWSIAWCIWGASSPSDCKHISIEEKKYISNSLGDSSETEGDAKQLKTPWCSFFTSLPFLVLTLVHCTNNWGFWTLLTEIPSYMKNILNMDIKQNALMSALPYTAMFLMSFVFSAIQASLNRHNCLPLSVSRKLFNSIGHWIPVLSLIALGYIDKNQSSLAIALLTITMGVNGATYLGFQVNHIDLSPNFAGILMGITNCCANITGIIAPLVVGLIVTDEKNPDQWHIIFFIAAGFYFLGNLMFVLFGKTTVQSWNDVSDQPTTQAGQAGKTNNCHQMESQQ